MDSMFMVFHFIFGVLYMYFLFVWVLWDLFIEFVCLFLCLREKEYEVEE